MNNFSCIFHIRRKIKKLLLIKAMTQCIEIGGTFWKRPEMNMIIGSVTLQPVHCCDDLVIIIAN